MKTQLSISEAATRRRIERKLTEVHGTIGEPGVPAVQLRKARGADASLWPYFLVHAANNEVIGTGRGLIDMEAELDAALAGKVGQ